MVLALDCSSNCNGELTSRFLRTELAPDEMAALEAHLDVCAKCRVRVESESASEAFWVETKQLLLSHSTDLVPPFPELSLDSIVRDLNRFDTNEIRDGILNEPFQDVEIKPLLDRTASVSQWLDSSIEPGSIGRIGKYEIQTIIGQGGMGLVLKAFDTELNRPVALKTIASFQANSDDHLRLIREARTIATLRHPHIVPIYGVEKWREVPVMVMPLIEEGTLQQAAKNQKLKLEQILDVGEQITKALSGLHQIGFVHRDLKPSNILLQDGLRHVLLSDFGLARAGTDSEITLSNVLAGTPYFMSPEQSLGLSLDHRSDLFSLGSVLYWLCTKEYPFRGRNQFETLSNVVRKEVDFQALIDNGVPDLLRRVIRGLLEKDPDRRWRSSNEVGELLRSCKESLNNPNFEIPAVFSTFPGEKRILFERDAEVAGRPRDLELNQKDIVPFSSSINDVEKTGRLSIRTNLIPFALAILAASALVSFVLVRASGTGEAKPGAGRGAKPGTDPKASSSIESTRGGSVEERAERYGSLDCLDRITIGDELERGENLRYWLRRLAYLPAEEIPSEVIPALERVAEHPDPTIRELASEVLNKNPFQEIAGWENSSAAGTESNFNLNENPFVEVKDEKK